MNVDFWKGFGIGIGLGTCIGIGLEIAYEKYQDKKYSEQLYNDAIEAQKAYLNGFNQGLAAGEFELDVLTSSDVSTSDSILMTDSFEINPIGGDTDGDDVVNYSKMYEPSTRKIMGMTVGSEDVRADEKISTNEVLGDPTELITADDFNTHSEFEKVFCAYAQDDEGKWLLTNDNGNEEMVIENTIGTKHLGSFAPISDEDDAQIIFVRNKEKMVDYMVTKYEYVE